MTGSACAKCDRKQKDTAGLCKTRLAADGLPAMCVGPWANDKHYYVGRYGAIFARGMKKKWPGVCFNNENELEIEGSPLLAVSQPFAHYIFAEADEGSARALKERLARRGISQEL